MDWSGHRSILTVTGHTTVTRDRSGHHSPVNTTGQRSTVSTNGPTVTVHRSSIEKETSSSDYSSSSSSSSKASESSTSTDNRGRRRTRSPLSSSPHSRRRYDRYRSS
ncbi:hypothetical protein DPMN_174938 [Dreissena polymorpha]|uniref:Uncharacterized protein n=1 Tax=Dreissena polymorpha TaxID=45954 RepID=A0A9D4E785_DREPO|nr:hypothetical protein DPMN_174938 [Dreissena polymorpha]